MTVLGVGSPKWGPDTQELSLKVTFPTQITQCSNVRYMFAGCLHILLLRCTQHPICRQTVEYGTCTDSEFTLFNTCPNPRKTFSAVEAPGSCPVCADQADTRLKIIDLEARIAHLQAEIKQCRAARGGMSFSSMRSELLKAELQRAKEANQALIRSFDACGGGPGMDVLGLRASYEPGKFNKVASPWWGGCEGDDRLWGWGLDS